MFKVGDTVSHTDAQGVTTTGRVRRVDVVRGYADPTKVVRRYYVIDGLGVAVSDGIKAVSA